MAATQNPQGYGLTELPPEPRAVPGCNTCLGMCVRRDNARSRRDYSAVSDANVKLCRHHEEAHGT
jgi:hypothetical protein